MDWYHSASIHRCGLLKNAMTLLLLSLDNTLLLDQEFLLSLVVIHYQHNLLYRHSPYLHHQS